MTSLNTSATTWPHLKAATLIQVTNIPAVLEKNEISPLLLFKVGLPGIGELTVYGAANGKAIELGVAGL